MDCELISIEDANLKQGSLQMNVQLLQIWLFCL